MATFYLHMLCKATCARRFFLYACENICLVRFLSRFVLHHYILVNGERVMLLLLVVVL